MAQKDIKVAYGVDVDAVAGWLGSYGGEDSPDDISRGLFAGGRSSSSMARRPPQWSLPVMRVKAPGVVTATIGPGC
jgi:hypothetical protein